MRSDAINFATAYNPTAALFALGSYTGGNKYLQELSTSTYDVTSSIAVPKFVENASLRCKTQTAILPYHVPNDKLSHREIRKHERT